MTNNINVEFLRNEEWKRLTSNMVPGITDNYSISNYGRIYSHHSEKILRPFITDRGYHVAGLMLKNGKVDKKRVHRLVMIAFNCVPNYKDLEVNHKDGNKSNNHVSNLEWSTGFDNIQHAFQNNLKYRSFTDDEAHIICRYIQNGVSFKDIATHIGLEYTRLLESVFSAILTGKNYKHISQFYTFPESKKKTPEEIVIKICECLEKDMDDREIAKELGQEYNEKLRGKIKDIYGKRYHKKIVCNYTFPAKRRKVRDSYVKGNGSTHYTIDNDTSALKPLLYRYNMEQLKPLLSHYY